MFKKSYVYKACHTGRKTMAPIAERAAAALELREAPTHAHVSSRDSGASKGLNFLTRPGRKVLHNSPADDIAAVNSRPPYKKMQAQNSSSQFLD